MDGFDAAAEAFREARVVNTVAFFEVKEEHFAADDEVRDARREEACVVPSAEAARRDEGGNAPTMVTSSQPWEPSQRFAIHPLTPSVLLRVLSRRIRSECLMESWILCG